MELLKEICGQKYTSSSDVVWCNGIKLLPQHYLFVQVYKLFCLIGTAKDKDSKCGIWLKRAGETTVRIF